MKEMYDNFIQTNKKVYTPLEVIDLFSEYVTPNNLEALVDHLTAEELAPSIVSFLQLNNNIYFNIGVGDLLKVIKK
jgi:hypothetical protein